MDNRDTEREILENKLLHPTAVPVSLPLWFLKSITCDFCDEQELGRGGYGVVYKGRLLCGLIVAVKKFNDIVVDDDQFQKEATFLMGIQHQNIVRILGYCAESRSEMMEVEKGKGQYVLAEIRARMLCFEYMPNKDLDEYLSDEYSGLEWKKRYEIIKGICRALDFLHNHDIVHLDLKPQNILMDADMMPKIADFGLSRLLGEQKSSIVTVNRAGTMGYMAPEYINNGIISKKADIFSLGVIIIQILKGRKDNPDYHLSMKTDFQHFTDEVLGNWRNRFEIASNYTELELPTQQVELCIKIALQCVQIDKEKRPNTSKIITEIFNVEEGSCCVQNIEDLLVDHQDMQRRDGVVALNRSLMKDYTPSRNTGVDMGKSVVAPPQSLHEPPVFACVEGSLAALHHQGAASLAGWAAALNLGQNVEALQLELMYAKASHLKPTLNREKDNRDLNELLLWLQDLCYDAEDILDEMEYFCMLDASSHAADRCAEGCTHNQDYDSDDHEPPKFDRVNAPQRMQHIVEKMRTLRQEVSEIITRSGSDRSTAPNIEQSRPITRSESIEPKLYGRELMLNSIIHDITKGKHSTEVLTVIPIVGPGGIGKTTLAQHIYHSREVQEHFDVRVWTCVSFNFNVNKLVEEIQRYIPEVDYESSNGTASELIGERLKKKRFFLVLDDIWDCSDEDEWKRLLVPFRKSQVQGNIIIVTTRVPAQAKIMARKKDQSIYLQGLENKEFEELFLEIIFGDDDQSRKDHTFLHETGFMIAGRLKGSPLAAKTVGGLLKTKLDLAHWTTILESKEWEHSNGKNDIMPALKLSFDHLPPQLQQCFSYCALFPQDYLFEREELVNFWIGQEVLHSSHGEDKRVEDIGLCHLTELVNYGFFLKKVYYGSVAGRKYTRTYYIIHDLLHELAQKVSSLECLRIDYSQSQVSSSKVLPSIRHLSINIDDTSTEDRLTIKNCVENLCTLDTILKVQKLRTLMIFGNHHGCFVKAFHDLFREAKGLRVIFLSNACYDVENLLCNFYNLLHLRYLHIESSLPNKISRFYHMMVLEAGKIIELPRDMTNLVKLRHFNVRDDAIHSSISEVGKLKSLQELRRFVVKREAHGFELKEIGHLIDLSGLLRIDNLQNVEVKEEADEAKLLSKGHLHELVLHWDNTDQSTNHSTLEEHVLERLMPSRNLLKLSVKGHRGATCPSWLGTNLSLKNLESLCLEGVAWKKFPPIGQLWLVDLPRKENISGNIIKERFRNLRSLQLCKLNMVEKWEVHAPCQLFPFLEVLIIEDCPCLVELSFQHFGCCQQGKEVNANLFPRLYELKITDCPQLSSFPPVPWTRAPYSFIIERTGSSSVDKMVCEEYSYEDEDSLTPCIQHEYSLTIKGNKDTNDSKFWNMLDFHNLTGLKELSIWGCEPPPLLYLQMLASLRILRISCSSNTFPFVKTDRHVIYRFPVEQLVIMEWNASGKQLTQLLTYFPKLSDLRLWTCKKVTGLAVHVKGQRATETPLSSANKVEQQQDARAEDDVIVASEEAERDLLLLPPQLLELEIRYCPELSLLRSNPHDDSNEEDGRSGGGGLQGTSLRRLEIGDCPKLLSAYSSSSLSSSFPFPNSLEHLHIQKEVGTEVLSLSNLTSLTSLELWHWSPSPSYCRGDRWLSLLTQGHLTKLSVSNMPNFFVDSDPSQMHEQEIPSSSSKLQELKIDNVPGFTAASLCHSLLFSSLTTLEINEGEHGKVERFTEEQEALLFVNSLEEITFEFCLYLQSLPERLHRLPNLKRLNIWNCLVIQMPPKDGLPSSLEELDLYDCGKMQSLPKDCLPDSLQKLRIRNCPAIRLLPEVDDLPSSLRELDVRREGSFNRNSEELRNQCHRFINIIPIVRT